MKSMSSSCVNCGACCRKGGPALHTKDAYLFEENILQIQDVVTIRAGELVRDDMKNRLVPLPAELVKLAPAKNARPDDWTCRFLTNNNRCFLHGKHPAECRAFYCKEPEALMQLSNEPRLEREKICEIINAPGYWTELIKTHEETVGYEELGPWALKIDEDSDARQKFLEKVEFDRSFRELVVEKKAAPEEALPFLFGRPLLQTMIMFKLEARPVENGFNIVKMPD